MRGMWINKETIKELSKELERKKNYKKNKNMIKSKKEINNDRGAN
jgi:hypothetical protein